MLRAVSVVGVEELIFFVLAWLIFLKVTLQ